MKSKKIVIALTLTLLISLVLSFGFRISIAPEPSESWAGYNLGQGKWTKGNLGSEYVEGDWVSYQLRIDPASKVWGTTEFIVSFNFHQDNTNAIYIDGFDTSTATGFQYQIDGSFLPDGQQTPSPAWTHIPTPEPGEAWVSGPRIINYMDPFPLGSEPSNPDSTTVADERYFSVNGLPWGSATTNIYSSSEPTWHFPSSGLRVWRMTYHKCWMAMNLMVGQTCLTAPLSPRVRQGTSPCSFLASATSQFRFQSRSIRQQ